VYIGPEKIILVLVIGLIVLGPDRLPQVARQVGRGYREFRRVTSGLDAEVRQVLHEPLRQAFAEPQPTTARDPDASSSETEETSGAPPAQGSDPQLRTSSSSRPRRSIPSLRQDRPATPS